MIIKYYTADFPGTLFIIEGATEIKVPTSLYSFQHKESPEDWPEYQVSCEFDKNESQHARMIYFEKQGVKQRLTVFGTAYICNDDGRTIEKVSP